MNNRAITESRGFTFLDVFVLLACLFVAAVVALKADDVYEASFRDTCWDNQRILESVLHETLMENGMDPVQVMAAYTVFDPKNPIHYRMVINLLPVKLTYFKQPGAASPEGKAASGEQPNGEPEKRMTVIVKDMEQTAYGKRILCPLRHGEPPKQPVIDYWYAPMHRWHCLHNEYHN